MARSINTTASRTTAAQQQTASVSTPTKKVRINAGSVWKTTGEKLAYAGALRPRDGDYANDQELIDRLPDCPPGYIWRVKAFVNRSTSPKSPALDIRFELEPEQRQAE